MTSRRCCRRGRSSTSSRGTTTRKGTNRIRIRISGLAGATAPSTRWVTPGSTSRTTATTSSRPSSPSAHRQRPRPRAPRSSNKPFDSWQNEAPCLSGASFFDHDLYFFVSFVVSCVSCRGWKPGIRGLKMRRSAVVGVLIVALAGTVLGRAGKQGVGQTPSSLPLSQTIRERGTSVTPAYEGWYYDKDGSIRLLVGYFNRNTKQEFDIPAGPNNRVEPGGPDMGQPTHFGTGRGWGVFSIGVPKDFGNKKLTWTIVANGFTNAITLHTQADYVVEPFEDAANKNTPPTLKFKESGETFTGPPSTIAEKYTATAGAPLAITVWATDE